MAKETYATFRAWATTHRKLNLISALTGVTMTQILDSLISEKLDELIRKDPDLANQSSLQDQDRPD